MVAREGGVKNWPKVHYVIFEWPLVFFIFSDGESAKTDAKDEKVKDEATDGEDVSTPEAEVKVEEPAEETPATKGETSRASHYSKCLKYESALFESFWFVFRSNVQDSIWPKTNT